MTLLVLEHGTQWEPVAQLQPDGTILHGKQGVIGGIGADQLFDRNRRSILWCAPDRTLRSPAQPAPVGRFDERDRLVDAEGSILWVGDDGALHWEHDGRDLMGAARFDRDVRGAKRTAVVLAFAALANARWSF